MFDRPGQFGPLFECIQARLFQPMVQKWLHHRLAFWLLSEEEDLVLRASLSKYHWEAAMAAKASLTQREVDAADEFLKLVQDELDELEELEAYYAG